VFAYQFHVDIVALTCNNDFEGGGWALVRRVKKGTVWHASKDNLRGTASYGMINARINDDSSFSVPYVTNVWTGTEFLFMIGTLHAGSRANLPNNSLTCNAGIGDKYLITTWDAINNGGAQYTGLDRSISRSSASSAACLVISILSIAFVFNRFRCRHDKMVEYQTRFGRSVYLHVRLNALHPLGLAPHSSPPVVIEAPRARLTSCKRI
jgi:hypothetical protein